jgi:putative NADPH-quinone reductase
MKVMVINAAPRMKTGNTHTVLSKFIEGMSERITDIETVFLARMNFKPCMGCFKCYGKTPGVCAHSDDMTELATRIKTADLLIFATPVYIDGMTSWGKMFFDRLVVCLDPHFTADAEGLVHPLRSTFPKGIFLVSVCGYPGLQNFEPLVSQMKRICRNFHAKYLGALLRPAVFSILLKKQYPAQAQSVMDAIKKAGEELARDGFVGDAVLAAAAQDICSSEELMAIANSFWDRESASAKS